MSNNDGEPVQALCVGEAGSGKSTLVKRLVWLWASGNTSSYFWSKIKAVLFVTSEDENETLEETIRACIPGKDAYKDSVMDLLKDEPEAVLVIVEAFEDFQNPCVIKETEKMIRSGATNVFMTVRKDNPKLTRKYMSMFNQVYEVKGFLPEHGGSYAEKLLNEMDCQLSVKAFLEAISGKPQFETNPLNLTLACQLYSDDELKSSDMETLTEVNLYSMREDRMVEREYEKQQVSDDLRLCEIRKIHNLALYCLLKKNLQCTKPELEAFNIEKGSPALILLEKHTRSSTKHGNNEFWSWPHSRLLEFDAVMALSNIDLKNSIWLLWIASKPDLNQAAQILTAILCTDNKLGTLKTLTTATIILQSKANCSATSEQKGNSVHSCDWITTVKEKIQYTMTLETCFRGGQCEPLKTDIDIPSLEPFTNCCGSLYNGNASLFQHVQDCWRLGLLGSNHEDFITSCNSILLPAVDMYEQLMYMYIYTMIYI